MKCPKCDYPRCRYTDRVEIVNDEIVVGYKRKRASDGTTETKKNEPVRKSDEAECKKCNWKGVM